MFLLHQRKQTVTKHLVTIIIKPVSSVSRQRGDTSMFYNKDKLSFSLVVSIDVWWWQNVGKALPHGKCSQAFWTKSENSPDVEIQTRTQTFPNVLPMGEHMS